MIYDLLILPIIVMALWDFKNTKKYSLIRLESKQEKFYRKNNSSDEIMRLVTMSNRQFGCVMESIILEMLGLQKSKNTLYDTQYDDIRIEIKASRYWVVGKKSVFRWQHIEPEKPFDILLLVSLNFSKIQVYAVCKRTIHILISLGVLKKQGGGNGQGFWVESRKILPYCLELDSNINVFQKMKQIIDYNHN